MFSLPVRSGLGCWSVIAPVCLPCEVLVSSVLQGMFGLRAMYPYYYYYYYYPCGARNEVRLGRRP